LSIEYYKRGCCNREVKRVSTLRKGKEGENSLCVKHNGQCILTIFATFFVARIRIFNALKFTAVRAGTRGAMAATDLKR
jgi:hypothetical protein